MPEPTQKDISEAEKIMFDVELDADGHATRVLRAHTIDEFVQEIAQSLAQAREEGRKEGLEELDDALYDLACDQCGSTNGDCSYCKMD